MRYLVSFVAALALVACAPAASTVVNAVSGSDGATLTLARTGETVAVEFAAGPRAAESAALFIGGSGLAVNDPLCKPVSGGLGCNLGTVPAGRVYALVVRGRDVSANITFYRSGSARPYLVLGTAR